MNVIDAIKSRISIRAFTDKPVAEQELRALLDIARWSPSGGNLQPWKVIAVAGAEKQAVSDFAQRTLMANMVGEADEFPIYPSGLEEPYKTRRYEVGEEIYALLGIARDDKAGRYGQVARNFLFFDAPVGLFFVIDRAMGNGQWAHLGMFMQTLALAAEAKGLGTCMQESWAMVRKSLHKHFNLPENEVVYCGMALGHPDRDAAVNTLRSKRAAIDEIATLKGFG
ncbi:MAG: nitroreductase [Pseudomonadota bacterium]